MFSKSHHFAITGGAGFIGSHLAKELVRLGQQVTVIDNLCGADGSNLKEIEGKIQFVQADVCQFPVFDHTPDSVVILFTDNDMNCFDNHKTQLHFRFSPTGIHVMNRTCILSYFRMPVINIKSRKIVSGINFNIVF